MPLLLIHPLYNHDLGASHNDVFYLLDSFFRDTFEASFFLHLKIIFRFNLCSVASIRIIV